MSRLNDFEYTMSSCNHCGQCKWILPSRMHGWDFSEICPIYKQFGFDAYSGQGLINIAKERMNGVLEYGDGLEEMLYTCSACGACDVNCKSVRDMELLETIYALREDCAEAGYIPEVLQETARNIEAEHNIYGLPHEERFAFLDGIDIEENDCDVVLFAGCSAYRHPENILAAIKILQKGGVRFRLLREEEWCCGGGLWRTGQRAEAEKLIRRNCETFGARGVKKIITVCAECYGSFRSIYPRFVDTEFDTVHISEIAAELLRSGNLQPKAQEKVLRVTYHDPCMLGRLSEPYVHWEGIIKPYGIHEPEKQWRRGEHGQYSAPREVLKAMPGVELLEMPRNMEESFCCGAGGGTASVNPRLAVKTADERRREALSVDAELLVSSCPFCQDALDANGENSIPYADLSVLLADRL
ncbi:MAG: (Fe-S)-binding protein [Ruminococcaceae bacterium]|nr:(Fe-S)-binding protein [Oscillospiraceae bacterium]